VGAQARTVATVALLAAAVFAVPALAFATDGPAAPAGSSAAPLLLRESVRTGQIAASDGAGGWTSEGRVWLQNVHNGKATRLTSPPAVTAGASSTALEETWLGR
jgi:hypothetical protein